MSFSVAAPAVPPEIMAEIVRKVATNEAAVEDLQRQNYFLRFKIKHHMQESQKQLEKSISHLQQLSEERDRLKRIMQQQGLSVDYPTSPKSLGDYLSGFGSFEEGNGGWGTTWKGDRGGAGAGAGSSSSSGGGGAGAGPTIPRSPRAQPGSNNVNTSTSAGTTTTAAAAAGAAGGAAGGATPPTPRRSGASLHKSPGTASSSSADKRSLGNRLNGPPSPLSPHDFRALQFRKALAEARPVLENTTI